MFILEDGRRQRVAVLIEEPGVAAHLIASNEAAKYPLWSLVDNASPAWFGRERMAELVADLRRLKSREEIALRQAKWQEQVQKGVAWLEADLAADAARGHVSEPMSSVLNWMREALLLAQSSPPEFPECLREESVVPYVDAIIALALRCEQIGGFLGHDPFANEE